MIRKMLMVFIPWVLCVGFYYALAIWVSLDFAFAFGIGSIIVSQNIRNEL